MIKRLVSEWLGSFSLVFFGCGCTALASGYLQSDVAVIYQATVFGLVVAVLFHLLRPVSGAHFNPAVTIGFALADRFSIRDLVPYIAVQLVGAVCGAAALYVVVCGRGSVPVDAANFSPNGYGEHSPNGYSAGSAMIVEALVTFIFVLVNLAISRRNAVRFGGAALVGVSLMLCTLIAMPVTNASMNPARSTGIALVAGGYALDQLWLFWAAPLLGGLMAGLLYPLFARGGQPPKSARAVKSFGNQLS